MLDYIFLCIKNQQIFKSGIDSKVCLMKIYKLQVTILAFGKILYGLACLYILNIKKFVLFFSSDIRKICPPNRSNFRTWIDHKLYGLQKSSHSKRTKSCPKSLHTHYELMNSYSNSLEAPLVFSCLKRISTWKRGGWHIYLWSEDWIREPKLFIL